MLFLLFVFFLGKPFEGRQRLLPKLGEMIAQERKALQIQLVNAAGAGVAIAHETSLLEHAQVLRYRGARDRQLRRQFVYRVGMIAEHLEDSQAGRIAESCEAVLYVSIHLR